MQMTGDCIPLFVLQTGKLMCETGGPRGRVVKTANLKHSKSHVISALWV